MTDTYWNKIELEKSGIKLRNLGLQIINDFFICYKSKNKTYSIFQ